MELPFSFGHRNSVTEKLTPLSAPGAIYDGKSYPTAQHLFEAAKFLPHRPDIAEAILETRNAHEAVNVSAREKQAIREDWAQIAQEKADEVLYHKFVQNEGARRTLLRTGNMKLVCEHPDRWKWPRDAMSSEKWNEMERSLMSVRDKLRWEGVQS
ncbi:hypothetical protein OF83DRAFT_1068205 [Amylostereum chailletii]|nr:hypothetical protein OF83DRAFT_1068205 [Amylostereum chailletii]